MAKYKFTKTIRPTEGICINADGTVTELPVPSVSASKKIVVSAVSTMTRVETKASQMMRDRATKKDKRCRSKRFVPIDLVATAPSPRLHRKPIITIPLSSVANPYYGEPAIHDAPSARPCGVFGISMPKPITRAAAMIFQKRD